MWWKMEEQNCSRETEIRHCQPWIGIQPTTSTSISYIYIHFYQKKISNSNNTPLDTEHHQHHYPQTNSQKSTISVKKLRKLKLPVPQHQVEQPLQLDQHWEQQYQYQSWCLVKKTLYVAVRVLLTIFYVIIAVVGYFLRHHYVGHISISYHYPILQSILSWHEKGAN